ncbi:hypothetical protein U9M48_043939, partial [Paspalum notatum var. saurae]
RRKAPPPDPRRRTRAVPPPPHAERKRPARHRKPVAARPARKPTTRSLVARRLCASPCVAALVRPLSRSPRLAPYSRLASSPFPPHPHRTRVNQPNPRRLSRPAPRPARAPQSLAALDLPRRPRAKTLRLSLAAGKYSVITCQKCRLRPSPSRKTDQPPKLQKSNQRLPQNQRGMVHLQVLIITSLESSMFWSHQPLCWVAKVLII